jgi:dTDP-4-amino-4,6-dideoxygalactose transaminase
MHALDPSVVRVAAARPDARSAITDVVGGLDLPRPPRVMIPAYYGASPREGSGVMDPLAAVGAEVSVYPVTTALEVDVEAYRLMLAEVRPDVVMLIHWFGWVDPAVAILVDLAHAAGAFVLEDQAHSMLTDLVGRGSGRWGDASAVSVHKSLPLPGGLLISRRVGAGTVGLDGVDVTFDEAPRFTASDLATTAERRRRLAGEGVDLLSDGLEPLVPLRRTIPDDVVPMNLPVLVPPSERQRLYEEMNDSGVRVACLYYRLGPGIDPEKHPASLWLSQRLMNVPLDSATEQAGIAGILHDLARRALGAHA